MIDPKCVSGGPLHSPEEEKPPAPPRASSVETWLDGGAGVLDREGNFLSVNDSLAIWLDATPGELHGQSLSKLLGHRHPHWEIPVHDFLEQTTVFDRLEIPGPDHRAAQRLAIEVARHSDSQFVRVSHRARLPGNR